MVSFGKHSLVVFLVLFFSFYLLKYCKVYNLILPFILLNILFKFRFEPHYQFIQTEF